MLLARLADCGYALAYAFIGRCARADRIPVQGSIGRSTCDPCRPMAIALATGLLFGFGAGDRDKRIG